MGNLYDTGRVVFDYRPVAGSAAGTGDIDTSTPWLRSNHQTYTSYTSTVMGSVSWTGSGPSSQMLLNNSAAMFISAPTTTTELTVNLGFDFKTTPAIPLRFEKQTDFGTTYEYYSVVGGQSPTFSISTTFTTSQTQFFEFGNAAMNAPQLLVMGSNEYMFASPAPLYMDAPVEGYVTVGTPGGGVPGASFDFHSVSVSIGGIQGNFTRKNSQ